MTARTQGRTGGSWHAGPVAASGPSLAGCSASGMRGGSPESSLTARMGVWAGRSIPSTVSHSGCPTVSPATASHLRCLTASPATGSHLGCPTDREPSQGTSRAPPMVSRLPDHHVHIPYLTVRARPLWRRALSPPGTVSESTHRLTLRSGNCSTATAQPVQLYAH